MDPATSSITAPVVALCSHPDELGIETLSHFQKRGCYVIVISKEVDVWHATLQERGVTSNYVVYDPRHFSPDLEVNYFIFLDANFSHDLLSDPDIVHVADKILRIYNPKSSFVFSYFNTATKRERIDALFNDIKGKGIVFTLIYVGDVLDAPSTMWHRTYRSTTAHDFHPLYSADVIAKVERSLFSFSSDEVMGIVGRALHIQDVYETVRQKTNVGFSHLTFEVLIPPSAIELIIIPTDGKEALDELVSYYLYEHPKPLEAPSPTVVTEVEVAPVVKVQEVVEEVKETTPVAAESIRTSILMPLTLNEEVEEKQQEKIAPVVKTQRKKIRLRNPLRNVRFSLLKENKRASIIAKRIAFVMLTLLFVLMLPFALLLVNYTLIKAAGSQIEKERVGSAAKMLKVSTFIGDINTSYLHLMTRIPSLQNIYTRPLALDLTLHRLSEVGSEYIEVRSLSYAVAENIVSNEPSVVSQLSQNLVLSLESLHTNLGFLEGDINALDGVNKNYIKDIYTLDTEEVRERILFARTLIAKLPELTGVGAPKTYLVALQDNSIARPNGGVIDGYMLLALSGGKLVDAQVYSSDYIDQQIKGVVETPTLLTEYFDKETWSTHDANLDVSFVASAQQAEWFIDKSLGVAIDGTFFVTKEDFAGLLSSLLINADFDSEYEQAKTDSDTYDQFVGEMIEKIVTGYLSSSDTTKSAAASSLSQSLSQNNIQLYLHDVDAQNAVNSLGWMGYVNTGECGNNCYHDLIAVVEMQKEGSAMAERSMKIQIDIQEGVIKRQLVYTLDRSDESSDEKYESYIRLVGNDESSFENIAVVGTQNESVTPELSAGKHYKTAGVYVEVAPGETKDIIFSWEGQSTVSLSKDGQYEAVVYKQSGVEEYPIALEYFVGTTAKVSGQPPLSLTNEGRFGYNTKLQRDITSHIFWKK